MMAFVISSAIQISTHTTKYTFASFLAHNTAYEWFLTSGALRNLRMGSLKMEP